MKLFNNFLELIGRREKKMSTQKILKEFEIIYNTYMNTVYKSNSNIVYSCKYHVVWCPKYRRKILTNGIDTRLKELLFEYAANISVDIMEIMPAIHNRDTNASINNLNKGLQMQSAQAYIRLHLRAYENSIIELVDTV